MKLKALIVILIPLLFVGCDSLFDKGDAEKTYDGPAQVEFKPLQQEVSEISMETNVDLQLIGEQPTSDVTISIEVDGASSAEEGVHYNLSATEVTIPANSSTVGLPIEILDSGVFDGSGEVALILNISSVSGDIQISENLDQATIFIGEFERNVSFSTQATAATDKQVLASDVVAQPGDAVVITTNPADGDFEGESIVGYTVIEEALRGAPVFVEIADAAPGSDYVAHVIRTSVVSESSLENGVVSAETAGTRSNFATSSVAPVYTVVQFAWDDETAIDSTNQVTVDVIEIEYNGTAGPDSLSLDLHESDADGAVGAYVGVSAIDLEVNTEYTDVQVDVVEPVEAGDAEATRTGDYIRASGFYLSMVHVGPAATDADGGRIPAQQPPLLQGQEVDEEATFLPVSRLAEVTIDSVNVLP